MKNDSSVRIGSRSFEDFLLLVKEFHGSAAPGLILGGFMVEEAKRRLPENTIFDAVSETNHCLPDAVQLLTPCTIGNGWLRVINLGRYALTLFDKYEGVGVRVFLDPAKVDSWPHLKAWYMKLKPKKEQDSMALFAEIKAAGAAVCGVQTVRILPHLLQRRLHGGSGSIGLCPICQEGYPVRDGRICRACQGEAPYVTGSMIAEGPKTTIVPVDQAVGRRVAHDMTHIEPGKSKNALFIRGQEIAVGDICRLQQMGRMHVSVQGAEESQADWLHEDEAAASFALAMAGEGVEPRLPPREGKVDLVAGCDGLLEVRKDLLEAFNLVPDVMCGSRHDAALVKQGMIVAGTRAIPLHLHKGTFLRAMSILEQGPLFCIRLLRKAKVGVLVTGTEVFQGLVEDKFIPAVSSKVQALGSEVTAARVVPDERRTIAAAARELVDAGVDMLVTTAGLSVDPDDVTRQGLLDAGVEDLLYGTPILPGAMTLFARLGRVQVLGVPACALFFKTTALDLFLPRLLAGRIVNRKELAGMGEGGLCMQCRICTFPKCPFGK